MYAVIKKANKIFFNNHTNCGNLFILEKFCFLTTLYYVKNVSTTLIIFETMSVCLK